ncbi:Opacity-associated protein A domain protein [Rouxiella silvae]|uniref:Opacity-associated protein A domain protein n=1 Tax=Rouxiella silvae TaxID=1646373 RepID=A0AA41BVM0_9GAMM|nr:LysM-like peptidoglycan-binding domain-containing protein [Rouxiella silvae]KQN43625.1 Opacity-associated protein A domain protein [Serratia sp. Leaf50]MBF6636330.1 Opacity-associated protein A domain protein [Rouxiella silvae]ORJ19592.1 Opacity-associated protein A domain protein [Rouxiella silvae]
MGKYPPRRRKATRIYQPMLRSWISIMQKPLQKRAPEVETDTEIAQDEEVDTQTAGRPVLKPKSRSLFDKIWHFSDDFHWMEPLPYFHRRWLIISVIVVLVALLWPYSPENTYAPSDRSTSIPMQADLRNEQGRTTQMQSDNAAQPSASQNQGNWRSYQVQPGQTLAQLFRDNNLIVNDVFAMAQVEGNDKPLSNLHAGQQVRIQLNAQGVVTELQVTNDQNATVTFSRQSDGSYQRQR